MSDPGVRGGTVRDDEIEAGARGLHQRDIDDPGCDPAERTWEGLPERLKDQYREDAAAVRAALDRVRADRAGSERTVYDCAFNNARYAQPCDRCPAGSDGMVKLADVREFIGLHAPVGLVSLFDSKFGEAPDGR